MLLRVLCLFGAIHLCGCVDQPSVERGRGDTTPVGRAYGCTVERVAEWPLTYLAGWLPTTEASVNGQPARLGIDTGTTGLAHLHDALANAANVRSTGPFELIQSWAGTFSAHRARVPDLRVGDLTLADVEVLVAGTDTSMPAEVDGLLGISLLSQYDVEIDPGAKRIRLYDVTGCRTGQATFVESYANVPIRRGPGGLVLVFVQLDGAETYAVLDTGASRVIVTRQGALRAGVSSADLARAPRLADPDPRIDYRMYAFDSLEFGDHLFSGVSLPVVDTALPVDLVLGMDVIAAQRVWVSFATSTLFVDRRPAIHRTLTSTGDVACDVEPQGPDALSSYAPLR